MTTFVFRCPECDSPFRLTLLQPSIHTICPTCRKKVLVHKPGPFTNPTAVQPTKPIAGKPGRSNRWQKVAMIGLILVLVAGAGWAVISGGWFAADDDAKDEKNGLLTELSQKKQTQVREAVNKGVAYLKKRLSVQSFDTPYGYWRDGNTGAAALAGLTLLQCGVAKDDKAVQNAARIIRKKGKGNLFTYSLALGYVFLSKLGDNQDEALRRTLLLRLAASKYEDKGWGYWFDPYRSPDEAEIMARLKKGELINGGVERDSHSVTQFALMALWEGRQNSMPTDPSIAALAKYYRKIQNKNGSWGYMHFDRTTSNDSMTCVGLLSVAAGLGVQKKSEQPQSDAVVEKGLHYLRQRFDKLKPVSDDLAAQAQRKVIDFMYLISLKKLTPEQGKRLATMQRNNGYWTGAWVHSKSWGDLYFLSALQRVGMVYGIRNFGRAQWYGWGVDLILGHQSDDGSWREMFPGIPDTCFALQFLKHADFFDGLRHRLRERLKLPKHYATFR